MTSPAPSLVSMQQEIRRRRGDLVCALRSAAAGGASPALTARLDRLAVAGADAELRAELAAGRFRRVGELLAELGPAQSALGAQMAAHPVAVRRRIDESLAALRREPSAARVTGAAPSALCAAAGFDRALISGVRGSSWLPIALHVAAPSGGAVPGEFLRDAEVTLTAAMPEAELVRRRSAVLVHHARSPCSRILRLPVELAGSDEEYVAAPIVAGGAVLGLLHADVQHSGRPLRPADRDHVQVFADGLGLLLERITLMERAYLQQDRIAQALRAVRATTAGLGSAPVRLGRAPAPATPPTLPAPSHGLGAVRAGAVSAGAVPGGADLAGVAAAAGVAPARLDAVDAAAGPAGLTPREREVLRILAGGATNAQIAAALTVSETTVKSHVKHILRKLRATNRSEAVARYLHLARIAQRAL
ncbi:helix-turn-helix transcriptional regulator [Frankia sp. AvcI1]|uniref:helix-turn-helix transcriptional regulator n=1 Tax=Frankia sp. AvcI1 TaxID=573496 RepID=UPI001F38464D|nr:helix-turn-helix transcriptional regulator [Frankia sp. AvcI1]